MGSDPLLGRLIGNYRVERRLGSGGMGTVYEARHQILGQRVALKVMQDASSGPTEAQERATRFDHEARVLTELRHEGLVRLFDFGEIPDGPRFILMEFLEGETLQSRLRQAPQHRLDTDVALYVIQHIAVAMVHVHRKGIIHRDLKPANIMLVSDAESPTKECIKVLDFGIAKSLSDAARNLTKGIVGTAHYMAPEQATSTAKISGQADVYSLGCMLYEMLCGQPPFAEDGVEENALAILFRHAKDTPVPLRVRVPAIALALDALVLRMLEKNPGQRPTIKEVAAQTQLLLAETVAHPRAPRPTLLHSAWPRRVHRRIVGAGLASTVSIVALAVAFSPSRAPRPVPAPPPKPPGMETAKEAKTTPVLMALDTAANPADRALPRNNPNKTSRFVATHKQKDRDKPRPQVMPTAELPPLVSASSIVTHTTAAGAPEDSQAPQVIEHETD